MQIFFDSFTFLSLHADSMDFNFLASSRDFLSYFLFKKKPASWSLVSQRVGLLHVFLSCNEGEIIYVVTISQGFRHNF